MDRTSNIDVNVDVVDELGPIQCAIDNVCNLYYNIHIKINLYHFHIHINDNFFLTATIDIWLLIWS